MSIIFCRLTALKLMLRLRWLIFIIFFYTVGTEGLNFTELDHDKR